MLLAVVLLSVLHSARDVRSLSPEQARLALPVQGGDEFAVLLPETGSEAAHLVLEKLRTTLVETMQEQSRPVTFSVGAIVAETPPASFEALLKDADQLMYTVKKSGKNRLVLEARAH
jgi:diguanylate cyclase (GGDEF)-like protein